MKKDIVIYFVTKIIMGAVGFFLVSLYSSRLSMDAYGDYSLIYGLVSTLSAIFVGWIGSSALRYYYDYEKEKKVFYGNIITFALAMILVEAAIIAVMASFSVSIPIRQYFVQSMLLVSVFSIVDIFEMILRSSRKTTAYLVAVLLQSVASVIIFYVASIDSSNDATSIFASNISSKALFALVAIISLGVYKYHAAIEINKKLLKQFLRYGVPMIGVWGISWIMGYCDRYIIAVFYDSSQVGLYDMSYKLAENTINIAISAFTMGIMPALVYTWKKHGKKAVEKQTSTALKYYNLIAIPAVVGLCILSRKLFGTMIDLKYSSGVGIIAIVSIGMYWNGLNGILNKIWQLNEKTKNIFYIMLVSVAVNIILNIILIPNYGIIVAAITTLISYMVTTLITMFKIRDSFTIKMPVTSLIKTIISTLVMVAILLLFDGYLNSVIGIIIEVIIGIVTYAVSSVLLKNITINEIKGFKH